MDGQGRAQNLAGFDVVVKKEIQDELLLAGVRDLFMHPAVYIDDKDHRLEDNWYLTAVDRCWPTGDIMAIMIFASSWMARPPVPVYLFSA